VKEKIKELLLKNKHCLIAASAAAAFSGAVAYNLGTPRWSHQDYARNYAECSTQLLLVGVDPSVSAPYCGCIVDILESEIEPAELDNPSPALQERINKVAQNCSPKE